LLIGNEAWYRSHELRHADTIRWWVSYPTNLPSFRASAVPKTVQRLLRYDAQSGGDWDEPDGSKWEVYCFRWRGDNVVAQLSARNHRPEVCLSASGYELHDNLGLHFLPVNGLQLPFRQYVFDGSQGPLYVFFCLWEDEAEKQLGIRRPEYSDRLWPVFKGKRRLGQQTLEIIVSGYSSMAAAEQAVRERLPGIIKVTR